MARPKLDRSNMDVAKPLSSKQRLAAIMLARGKSLNFISKHKDILVDPRTIHKWQDEPAFAKFLAAEQDSFLTDARRQLGAAYIRSAAEAVVVLREQMEEGNDAYVRQGAARIMLDRFHNTMDKEEQKAVEIHFSGMPTLGSPNPDDNVPAADSVPDINKLINQ
jgi:hypothetical protein